MGWVLGIYAESAVFVARSVFVLSFDENFVCGEKDFEQRDRPCKSKVPSWFRVVG